MPNVWKYLSRPKAEPYAFPDASELTFLDPVPAAPPDVEEAAGDTAEEIPSPESLELEEEEKEEEEETADPVSFAQVQADHILQDAKARAEAILEEARQEAERQAQEIYENARRSGQEAGLAEGTAQGVAQALEESRRRQGEQAAELEGVVKQFLEQASDVLERQMDENMVELRDLAIAIAEKVVCVSLKSSSGVIERMIQTAIDKRKRREWVHIYIAECDAKYITKISPPLMTALSALSNRVRIIPMAGDESGTCIIEMPDEIIDASAGTQLNNIRTMLSDTPTGGMGGGLNAGRGALEYVPANDSSGL